MLFRYFTNNCEKRVQLRVFSPKICLRLLYKKRHLPIKSITRNRKSLLGHLASYNGMISETVFKLWVFRPTFSFQFNFHA